ncbi:MAG: GNAT family N-acetyltransferase [Bacteroidales bacterium]
MIEIITFRFPDKELYSKSFEIRTLVFIEEQHVPAAIEREFEEESQYYLLLLDNTKLATARWRQTAHGIKLERFAMLSEYRNKGYGSLLLDRVLADVLPLNRPIYLHAQENAVNYYKRKDFTIKGEAFEEAGIVHYKMIL